MSGVDNFMANLDPSTMTDADAQQLFRLMEEQERADGGFYAWLP